MPDTTTLSRHQLPPLPYATDALAPVIDAETLKLHHGKHHRTYVDKLNAALAEHPKWADMSLAALLARAGRLPTAARNNAGGHWNHSFFWSIMAPPGTANAPDDALAAAIDARFGSMVALREQFSDAAVDCFGSGWAWLVVNDKGRLVIGTTSNQDNPLMPDAELAGTPLLTIDVWEHAYYLVYQNARADFVRDWWQLVNWAEVSRLHAAATG